MATGPGGYRLMRTTAELRAIEAVESRIVEVSKASIKIRPKRRNIRHSYDDVPCARQPRNDRYKNKR